jgi:hypothetical protein
MAANESHDHALRSHGERPTREEVERIRLIGHHTVLRFTEGPELGPAESPLRFAADRK